MKGVIGGLPLETQTAAAIEILRYLLLIVATDAVAGITASRLAVRLGDAALLRTGWRRWFRTVLLRTGWRRWFRTVLLRSELATLCFCLLVLPLSCVVQMRAQTLLA